MLCFPPFFLCLSNRSSRSVARSVAWAQGVEEKSRLLQSSEVFRLADDGSTSLFLRVLGQEMPYACSNEAHKSLFISSHDEDVCSVRHRTIPFLLYTL